MIWGMNKMPWERGEDPPHTHTPTHTSDHLGSCIDGYLTHPDWDSTRRSRSGEKEMGWGLVTLFEVLVQHLNQGVLKQLNEWV